MSISDDNFNEYHENNPHVFRLFRQFALAAREKGYTKYSAKAIMERVRWEMQITTGDPKGFKINNNYTSRYARLLESLDPSFEGFFEKRILKSSKDVFPIAQPVSKVKEPKNSIFDI